VRFFERLHFLRARAIHFVACHLAPPRLVFRRSLLCLKGTVTSTDALFIPEHRSKRTASICRASSPAAPEAGRERSVLDITEFYGETTGGIRTYLREKTRLRGGAAAA